MYQYNYYAFLYFKNSNIDEQNKKSIIYEEDLSQWVVYKAGDLTNVVIPFDVSDKQIISIDLVSTGCVGVVNQALYYSSANGGIFLSAYSTRTQNIETEATVVVRYLLK